MELITIAEYAKMKKITVQAVRQQKNLEKVNYKGQDYIVFEDDKKHQLQKKQLQIQKLREQVKNFTDMQEQLKELKEEKKEHKQRIQELETLLNQYHKDFREESKTTKELYEKVINYQQLQISNKN